MDRPWAVPYNMASALLRDPSRRRTHRRRGSEHMRILILGGDGYLGWPTAMRFSQRGHEVHVVDNYLRRRAHQEAGTDSLTPIAESLPARAAAWREVSGRDIGVTEGDLTDWDVVETLFRDFQPETIVHYGEQPSAP